VKTEAVAEDITDDILCDMDNNFVVHFKSNRMQNVMTITCSHRGHQHSNAL